MTSRLFYTVCSIGLCISIQIGSLPASAQISPPPGSGTPGSTTGGGSRP